MLLKSIIYKYFATEAQRHRVKIEDKKKDEKFSRRGAE